MRGTMKTTSVPNGLRPVDKINGSLDKSNLLRNLEPRGICWRDWLAGYASTAWTTWAWFAMKGTDRLLFMKLGAQGIAGPYRGHVQVGVITYIPHSHIMDERECAYPVLQMVDDVRLVARRLHLCRPYRRLVNHHQLLPFAAPI